MLDSLRISMVLIDDRFSSFLIDADSFDLFDAILGSIIINMKPVQSEQSAKAWIE